MKERIIKIFMASSDELEGDRAIFGNLVRRLNDMYKRRGIYIELFQWEDFDATYNGRRKQSEYNDKVRESDLFLAFFHRKAGEFTVEEFDVALDEFNKNAQPKVYTYMRDLAPDESEEGSLKAFKERLYHDMGHYWCRYGNADTMKLHFVLQFQQMEENRNTTQIEVKDSTIKLDGEPIASLKNVPFAANNKDFQKMTERVAKLNEKVTHCREKLKKDPDNADHLDELREAIKELDEVSTELEQHEVYLFNLAKTFAQQSGKACTERMLRARELFEQGKAAEANGILDTEDITRDIAANERRYEQSKVLMEENRNNILRNIEELLLKTKTAMADSTIPVPKRFSQACAAYEQAIALQRKYDVTEEDLVYTLFDYASLLSELNHFKEALPLWEECLEIFRKLADTDSDTHLYNLAIILLCLADLHSMTNHYDEAEKEYEEALEIFHRGKPSLLPEIAMTENSLANLCKSRARYRDAEMRYNYALGTRRELAVANPDAYLPSVATTLNDLANLCKDIARYYDAEKVYVEELEIHKYKAENNYVEALEICRKLAVANPDAHLPDVAMTLNNLANFHSDDNRCDEAEKEYTEALEIRKKLAADNPDVYLPSAAETLNSLANLYRNTNRYEEAEKKYVETLEIYRKLSTANPDAYLPDMVDTLSRLANIHFRAVWDGKAEKEYVEALEIYRKLSTTNPNAYLSKVSDTLKYLAKIHMECFNEGKLAETKAERELAKAKAERELAEAIEIFEQIQSEELLELRGEMLKWCKS